MILCTETSFHSGRLEVEEGCLLKLWDALLNSAVGGLLRSVEDAGEVKLHAFVCTTVCGVQRALQCLLSPVIC